MSNTYNWQITLKAPKKRTRKHRPALFLSTGELAKLWGVSDRTIRNYIYAGTLPAVRVGRGHWRIDPTQMQAGRTSIKEVTKIKRETMRRAEELLEGAAGPNPEKKDTPMMEVSENPFITATAPTRRVVWPPD